MKKQISISWWTWFSILIKFIFSHGFYLCFESKTFKGLWQIESYNNLIQNKAKLFLKEKKKNNDVVVTDFVLFFLHGKNDTCKKNRKIRIQFLIWLLKNNHK